MSGNERLNRKVFRWCWNDCRVDGCCCCTEYTSGFSFSPIGAAICYTHRIFTVSVCQTRKCVGNWLRSWKFTEVFNVGGARASKVVFPVSCAQTTGKVFLQTNSADGKHTFWRCFWDHNPPDIKNQIREVEAPNSRENSGSRNVSNHPSNLTKKNWLNSTVGLRLFFNSEKK